MRRCFYFTDLRQNAVFHNFSRKIALIQYSEPSKHAWAFSKTVQKNSKITYTASWFSLLISAKFSVNIKSILNINSILSALANDVYERRKTNGKAIKIARDY